MKATDHAAFSPPLEVRGFARPEAKRLFLFTRHGWCMITLNAIDQAAPSPPLFGTRGFRGRRRNSFSSSFRDMTHQILHRGAGFSDHRAARALHQPVISFPAAGHCLLPGVRWRFRHAGEESFGECVYQGKQRLLATAYSKDFVDHTVEAGRQPLLSPSALDGRPIHFESLPARMRWGWNNHRLSWPLQSGVVRSG